MLHNSIFKDNQAFGNYFINNMNVFLKHVYVFTAEQDSINKNKQQQRLTSG